MTDSRWGKVLVLGAGGQLGQELLRTVPPGVDCIGLDREQLDITRSGELRDLLAAERPVGVINAAAYTAVDRAEQDAEAAYAINAEGPGHLARNCAALGVRLLHVSTDFVFDGCAGRPYTVDAPTAPLGVYGASKRRGEQAVQGSGADYVIVRTGWVYSRFGANFVKTMLRLLAEREQLTVVEDQVGTPTWAQGLARTCWQLLTDATAFGLFHWSDAGAASWYDFTLAIAEEAQSLGLIDNPALVVPIPARDYPTPAQRPSFSVLDKTHTRAQLGDSGVHWRTALRQMLTELTHSD